VIDGLLQLWGGVFYLLNKIFFSFTERARTDADRKSWRTKSWIVYIIGLPAWVIIFCLPENRNWIAASLEIGGLPSMILGLVLAQKEGNTKPSRVLDHIALAFVVIVIIVSLYDYGGLTTLNQGLELALTVGYLVGTYLLAKKRPSGYLWFIPMNVACGWLMWREQYPWLMWQQVASLLFIVDAFIIERRRNRT
jgi:hypothetical protein